MRLRRLIGPAWRRQWRWLALGIALMLASGVSALVLLGLSGWLITASALTGLGMMAVLDIFTPGGGIRLAAITRTLSRYGERLATHRATLGLLASLRVNLLSRLLKLDEIQLRRLRRGDTLNRLTRDVEALDHLFSGVAGPLVTAAATTLGIALALWLLVSPRAAGVALLLGIAGAAVTGLMGRAGQRTGRAISGAEPELRRHCTESLEGLKSLVAERRVGDCRDRLDELSTAQIARQLRVESLDAIGRGLINASGFTAVWAMLLVVLAGVTEAGVSGPVAVLAVIVVLGMNEIWQGLPGAWRQLTQTRLAADRLGELAETKPLLPPGGTAMPRGQAVSMAGVRFAWAAPRRPIVDGLDLEIPPGERLLVAGPSGSGKTTLALLLMRQVDPDEGSVRLGELDLRDIDTDALRRHIGYLPQHPVVFADTLAANLRVAAPEADGPALVNALREAGLGDWLDTLDEGLETWLDEAGASLSGGEQRRLGLARLMLVDPPVVILDEPTTGLDPTTARALSDRLDRWLNDRTAVVISHEPELLPRYDRVLRL